MSVESPSGGPSKAPPGNGPPQEPQPGSPPAPKVERKWVHPLAIFALLMAVYHSNGGFLPARDATPNLYLPVQAIARGSLSFTPRESPFMFGWKVRTIDGERGVEVGSWEDDLFGRKASDLYDADVLVLDRPRYFLVPSVREGRFVNIYGPGAGLVAMPFFAVLSALKSDWRRNSGVLGYEGKTFASACVAGSAVLVFLTLLHHVRRSIAWLLTFMYGLGTCVWTEPTQALWQQTPTLSRIAHLALSSLDCIQFV